MANSKSRWAGRPPEGSGKLTSKIQFFLVGKDSFSSLKCDSEILRDQASFMLSTIHHLTKDQFLLAEVDGDFDWPILDLLGDAAFASQGYEEFCQGVSDMLGNTELANGESVFPLIEFAKLVFKSSRFPNPSHLGVLSRLSDALFLTCEKDSRDGAGLVPLRWLASHSYTEDSRHAPVTWEGGATLVQVSPTRAFSFGTRDAATEPEVIQFAYSGKLDDAGAKVIAGWLGGESLAAVWAWSTRKPKRGVFSKRECALFDAILEDATISVSLNLTEREKQLVEEYLPEVSPMFLKVKEMLADKKDELFWELFLHHGLADSLVDGGNALWENYLNFSKAQKVIQSVYLLPPPFNAPLPDWGETKAIISRFDRALDIDSPEERAAYLAHHDDKLLRLVETRAMQRWGAQQSARESLEEVRSAFRVWEQWQSLARNIPELIDSRLGD